MVGRPRRIHALGAREARRVHEKGARRSDGPPGRVAMGGGQSRRRAKSRAMDGARRFARRLRRSCGDGRASDPPRVAVRRPAPQDGKSENGPGPSPGPCARDRTRGNRRITATVRERLWRRKRRFDDRRGRRDRCHSVEPDDHAARPRSHHRGRSDRRRGPQDWGGVRQYQRQPRAPRADGPGRCGDAGGPTPGHGTHFDANAEDDEE